MPFLFGLALTFLSLGMARSAWADDGGRLLSIDHFVGVQSTVPAIAGQTTAGRAVAGRGSGDEYPSHDEFVADWDRQAGCPGQLDPAVRDAVWSAMIESDPVGATWGTSVRRAPQVLPSTNRGWT